MMAAEKWKPSEAFLISKLYYSFFMTLHCFIPHEATVADGNSRHSSCFSSQLKGLSVHRVAARIENQALGGHCYHEDIGVFIFCF